jgi:ribosomal protein S18 acetylase RimI-like enzyme
MYWNFKDYLYIFLIGTKAEYRRLKLGHFLMRKIKEKFPNKPIQLTSYKDADAY